MSKFKFILPIFVVLLLLLILTGKFGDTDNSETSKISLKQEMEQDSGPHKSREELSSDCRNYMDGIDPFCWGCLAAEFNDLSMCNVIADPKIKVLCLGHANEFIEGAKENKKGSRYKDVDEVDYRYWIECLAGE